jgi:hypothetical protein
MLKSTRAPCVHAQGSGPRVEQITHVQGTGRHVMWFEACTGVQLLPTELLHCACLQPMGACSWAQTLASLQHVLPLPPMLPAGMQGVWVTC